MFTGIIEDIGRILRLERAGDAARVWVETRLDTSTFVIGESVAVDGLCLTVVEVRGGAFRADVSSESLSRSTLSDASPGRKVNLERALRADGRFGGHFVLGHVDGMGRVLETRNMGGYLRFRIEAGREIMRYIIAKGSIAVDGVSLTVNETLPDSFTVMLIPATLAQTTLPDKQPGNRVNLETDILGKYVEKFLNTKENQGVTMERLIKEGFSRK